jgi:hypothetical protein
MYEGPPGRIPYREHGGSQGMLIYFSGNGRSAKEGPRNCDPENALKPPGCVMLTFAQCGVHDNNQKDRLKDMTKAKGGTEVGTCSVKSHFL